jgi:hypothetical protein
MKKFVLGIILAVFSAIAFALPSPKMIEGALQNGNYSDARSMVQQVLEEKPDSARAHLLDAFILIHADHNRQAAAQELDAARRLDTKGDVSGSPLFGRVTAEIDMTKDAPPVKRQTVAQTPVVQTQVIDSPVYQAPPKHESHAGTIFVVILVLVIIAILAYLFIRGATRRAITYETTYVPPYRDVSNTTVVSSGSTGLGYSAPARVAYNPPPAVVHQPVVVAPSPVIVGGYGNNNGFVEGMLVGEMMENNARLARIEDEDRYERRRRHDDSYSAPAVTPTDSWSRTESSSETKPSPVSYASEKQSFSSSRNDSDSWTSRDDPPTVTTDSWSSTTDFSSSVSSTDSWSSPSTDSWSN